MPPRRVKAALPKTGDAVLAVEGREVKVTNLGKPFWPDLGITKGDLIQYYIDVAPLILPHIRDRAMVMKRYPNGAHGDFFFMKRAPSPRPDWIRTVAIDHGSAGVIDFPVIDDLPSLIWVINLGCIDLNQWYARTADPDRPDYVHFDLDPGSAPWSRVVECALLLKDALEAYKIPCYAKTTGSKGIHIYIPIVHGPTQHEAWSFAKAFGVELAARHPELMTAEYVVAKRPAGRVLVDFNQNQWGRTLASVYSVRPHPRACVSTPVAWSELRKVKIEDFRLDNVRKRFARKGDLYAPVLHDADGPRFDLGAVVAAASTPPARPRPASARSAPSARRKR